MTRPSTEKSLRALLAFDGEIMNRGHAYFILKRAGQTGSGRVFMRAVQAYEAERGVKLASKNDPERVAARSAMMERGRAMQPSEVREHLRTIKCADELFWVLWHLFRKEGYWQQSVRAREFHAHFTSFDAEVN